MEGAFLCYIVKVYIDLNIQKEEKLNTYSHGIGILLSLIGFNFFLFKGIPRSLLLPIIIYSASLFLVFSASTMYHAAKGSQLKRKLRILDHISIYYLIAGTYTPVCLTILLDSKGSLLLYFVWGTAIFGTILKLFYTGKFEIFSLVLYGIMGWLVVIDFSFLLENSSRNGLILLGLGGFFYTTGILFYAIQKIPYNHFIWHLFVLGGAVSHWLFMYTVVLGS